MIILPEHKAVYVSCGRTGSHTMFAVLEEHYGGYHYKPNEDYHRVIVPKPFADYFLFRTVRNPYARAVSIWRAMLVEAKFGIRGMDFAEFAKGLAEQRWPQFRMAKSQHVWHFGNEYHETLQIEGIDSEARRLPFWSGPDHITPATNTTKGRPWVEEYNGPITRNVDAWAGPEFELYGYERLSWQAPSSQS